MSEYQDPKIDRVSLLLREVLESAARLQEVVPDAVLVGGTAAALYAGHRDSFDHDHVLTDLRERYLQVLEAVEATQGWATNVRASSPPVTLLGRLGGVEAGLRQLRRTRPLHVTVVDVAPGHQVRVPTLAETLRIKAYLIVQRNQTRDYLDVAALSTVSDVTESAKTIAEIDSYYDDRSEEGDSVLTAVVQHLSDPNPRDPIVATQLAAYKNLDPRWHSWGAVVAACQRLADAVIVEMEQL